MTESREAIQNIRSSAKPHANLSRALASVLEEVQSEFPSGTQSRPVCSIVAEGSEHPLRDYVTAEICRIAHESLRNSFQHAQANHVEIELSFRDNQLRLSFRDDGVGIEPSLLGNGARPGHWGLIGIRERAARLGAELAFWSKPGAGTEIELTIPGEVAYLSRPVKFLAHFRRRTKV